MNVIRRTIGKVAAATGGGGGDSGAPGGGSRGCQTLSWSEIKSGLKQRLGKGACGAVYYADIKRVGGPCAVKVLGEDGLDDDEVVSDFKKEVDVMKAIPSHPNVVVLLGVCMDRGKLAIVTEYCSGGDLREIIKGAGAAGAATAGTRFDWNFALRSALDVARGMEFLHGHGIIHRDLKGRNLLVNASGKVKVGDFGLATTRESASRTIRGGTHVMHDPVGTAAYMSPEILDGDETGYTKRVDIYAFGMLMWEVAALQYPLREYTNEVALARAVVDRGERPKVPRTWPKDYCSLMKRCWREDPDERPLFPEIVRALEAMKASWGKDVRAQPLGLPGSLGRHPEDDDTSSSSSGSSSGSSSSYSSSSSDSEDSDSPSPSPVSKKFNRNKKKNRGKHSPAKPVGKLISQRELNFQHEQGDHHHQQRHHHHRRNHNHPHNNRRHNHNAGGGGLPMPSRGGGGAGRSKSPKASNAAAGGSGAGATAGGGRHPQPAAGKESINFNHDDVTVTTPKMVRRRRSDRQRSETMSPSSASDYYSYSSSSSSGSGPESEYYTDATPAKKKK